VPAPTETRPEPPLLTLREAVGTFVRDGQEVLFGGFAYSDPFAAGHEIIRQGRRGLRVIKTSGGLLVDQLVGAGCVESLLMCHAWNSVGPEAAHCLRRATEHGIPAPLQLDELSFGGMTMALFAGACDLPFMPTTPARGAGHDTHRTFATDKLGTTTSPFDGREVDVVKPLRPDLGIFHVQRADRLGNAQAFGPTAELRYAIAACRQVVIVAEELVDTEVVRARPELTVAPAFAVDALVIEPWSAHPTDSSGQYLRDLEHHRLYGEMSATEEGFAAYLDEWVFQTGSHAAFVEKLGEERLAALRVAG
jgi:glutaconate CoA-transferase subunit A